MTQLDLRPASAQTVADADLLRLAREVLQIESDAVLGLSHRLAAPSRPACG